MEKRILTFHELMILGAIQGQKLDPFGQGKWNEHPEFYLGLAKIAKAMLKANNGFTTQDKEEYEFWSACNHIDECKKKVQETISLLQKKQILAVAQ